LPPWLDQRPWLLAGLTGLALAVPLGWYAMTRSPRGAIPELSVMTQVPQVSVQPLGSLSGHEGSVLDMLLLRDGDTLVTASADQTVRFWDLNTQRLLKTLKYHTNVVKALTMTTDQEILISAGDDRTIQFWDRATGQPLVTLVDAHPLPINALEVSNNGTLLISADSGGNIYLWKLTDQSGRVNPKNLVEAGPERTLQADGTVNDLLLTGDDSYLISGGKSLLVWTMADLLREPTALIGHEPLTFVNRLDISDDNLTLVSASSDKTVRLWNMKDRTPRAILRGHQGYVNDVRIEGQHLWSSDQAQTISVWDLQQNTHVETIVGFNTDIWRFAVRPNRHIVTLGGTEHVVGLWSLPAEAQK
jgi:WD40 repeat protein